MTQPWAIELKAAKSIADEHVAQLLGYLKSTRIEHGLLINFGSAKYQIKKFIVNDKAAVPEDFSAVRH
jgi:GxxExxY protein